MEQVTKRSINKVAFTALGGASVEWYDFSLYSSAAAFVFPRVFFSADLPPLVALVAAFATFALGFLVRPLGGILFGNYGDKYGRKKALVVALMLMGGATTLIGLLPTYESVGVLAPILLIALRLAQGLAFGGQWGGAVLLVTEVAPIERRGFYGSFAQAGVSLGIILANVIFLAFSTQLAEEDFISWGWRVPFLLSVILIGIALYVQLYLEDTPAFQHLIEEKKKLDATKEVVAKPVKPPMFEVLTTYPKQIALAAGAMMALSMAFYILITFSVGYAANPAGLGIPRNTMLIAVTIGAVFMGPMIFLGGAISDKLGRRGIYLFGTVMLGIWAFVMFPLIQTKSFANIVIAISVGLCFVGLAYGPQAALFSEMFSTKVRYSGASLGYQIGTVLGGAIAPLIATAVLAEFGTTLAISVYMAIVCTITTISVLLVKETYKNDLEKV